MFFYKTGGRNDELNADGGKLIRLVKFVWHGFVRSNSDYYYLDGGDNC